MSKINLYNIDCMEYMANCKDKQFDLAIVDPPYGININNNIGRRAGESPSNFKKITWDNSIPNKEYFEELFRISKNQIIWGGNYFTNYLKPSSCWLLWDKLFSDKLTFSQFEMCWTSFFGMTKKININPNSYKSIHPTQKPVSLYSWILQNYAKTGDKIFDSHLGSGSIAIACHDLGFDLEACELDIDYFNDAKNRLEQHQRQLNLLHML